MRAGGISILVLYGHIQGFLITFKLDIANTILKLIDNIHLLIEPVNPNRAVFLL